MSKVIDLSEFSCHVEEGAKIGIGGFDLHRKPLSLVLNLAENAKARDLELFGISLALEADLLIGGGKVKKLISSYTGLESFGQCYFFRESAESGNVSLTEMSTYAIILSLQAAALGVEYLPTKTMLHSDMIINNSLVKIISSPFSEERLAAVKSYRPDIALIHAEEADERGNVRIKSPPAIKADELLARASKRTFVSVEKISTKRIKNPTISGLYISHVIHSPGGTAPTSMYPSYDVNPGTIKRYRDGAKERGLECCKKVIADAIKRRREG